MSDDGLKLRELAEAGVKVLGSDQQVAHLFEHHCRNGTWLFVGAATAIAIISLTPVGPGWIVGVALLGGWLINEREARQIRARIRERESSP